LLEPVGEQSPITNFLLKRTGGLHHLCFEVDDIKSITHELVEKGFQIVSEPVDCIGYDLIFNCGYSEPSKVAFLLSKNKILIELLQKGE
jgi:catechol 2,3-dioxygenase-like lactoylglutathione lyase family enzyme